MHGECLPSHDPDAEERILGLRLLGRPLPPQLTSDDFYSDRNRAIFNAAKAVEDEGKPINDAVVVADRWLRDGTDAGCDRVLYLNDLMASVEHIGNGGFYAEIIRRKARARHTGWAVRDLLDAAGGEDLDPVALEEAMREVADRFPDLEAEEDDGTLTAAELSRVDPHVPYLIPRLLAEGQDTLIGAGKKQLKTTIMGDIAASLATGTPAMNYFPVSRTARVGVVSLESGRVVMSNIVGRVLASKGLTWDDIPDTAEAGLACRFSLPVLRGPKERDALRRWIERRRLGVVMLDPAYAILPLGDDAKSLFKAGEHLFELTRIGQDTGATMVLVHHTKKTGGNDPHRLPELGDLAFSGFPEWAAQWILLNTRSPFVPDPEADTAHELWLTTGGRSGHGGAFALDAWEGCQTDPGGRRWEVLVKPASVAIADLDRERKDGRESRAEEKAAAVLEDRKAKILAFLKRRTDGETVTAIREGCGLSGTTAGPAIESLLDDGCIALCQVSKGKRKHDGYRFVPPAEELDFAAPNESPGQTRTDPDKGESSGCPGSRITRTGHSPPKGGVSGVRVVPGGESASVEPDSRTTNVEVSGAA